jgi:hypothetical protein
MKAQPNTALGLPSLIYISVFELEDQADVDKALELITKKYAARAVEEGDKGIRLTLPDVSCTVELTKEKNCNIFSIGINRSANDSTSKGWQEDLEHYQQQLHPIINMLPKKPVLLLSVYIVPIGSQAEALKLVQQYSAYIGYPKVAIGVINNCLLATFRMAINETNSPLLRRNLLLLPINVSHLEGKGAVSDLLDDIEHLAINLGNLNRLYQLCQPYFPQVDPGETEIQEKIEVILNRIRQTEPVELETLKSWLSEVMDRFSTLSILSGLLKRDQINARTYIEENKNLLNRWGEISLAGYPTNTLMETIDYNSTLQPFKDFVDRTQALRTQLETVSDMVRTYLDIRQQEQSAEMLKQQVRMLHTIEGHEKILKFLTYWVVILTIALVSLEVLRILDILH